MTTALAVKEDSQSQGIIPFVTEVARYFMEFLETDFHKVRHPKRHIQSRNSANLQVTIDLNRYKKYSDLVWKVIRNGFDDDALNELKRGVYTNTIPKSLLSLISEQIENISEKDIQGCLKRFKSEIELGLSKNPEDTTAAISYSIDGIERVIREHFLSQFIAKIKEPLEKIKATTVDSVYQVEEELADVLTRPFEDAVSSIINQISLGHKVEANESLAQVFELADVKSKLEGFFKGFAANDLFYEVSELLNNKSLLEKQEFYLYFCDISYGSHTYPLFYVPVQIEKVPAGFTLNFDSLLYVNKKAVQFIAQSFNENIERKGVSLSSFLERIIYIAEDRVHLIGKIDLALKEAATYFGLNPIEINNPERQVSKGPGIQISNSCYLGLFDKSDESLINDYEEILLKLKDGQDGLAAAFQVLVDDFIGNNPISVVGEVQNEWDETSPSDKLVYTSPVPLNEEQRQILNALKKSTCKYVTVEGPPGTGKSHTITAIVCDAILNNQSTLVLSDKKEALDVVEDKITETMNKVRLGKDFQNPILRLGRAGSTYSKILSSTSMENIDEHYRAVRSGYKKLEESIEDSANSLKDAIKANIKAYDAIEIGEIAEFTRLEADMLAAKDLPISLIEFQDSTTADTDLESMKKAMDALQGMLSHSSNKIQNLFKNFFPTDSSTTAFKQFISFMGIVEGVKSGAGANVEELKKIRHVSSEGLQALDLFITKCGTLKATWLGYRFKGKAIDSLCADLAARLENDFQTPHLNLEMLKSVSAIFKRSEQLRSSLEMTAGFRFDGDYLKSVHQLLTLPIDLPTKEERELLSNTLAEIEGALLKYKDSSLATGANADNLASYANNKLTQYSTEEYERLARYLSLKRKLHDHFSQIPSYNYVEEKETVEELVTTQMAFKMDERVVDFYQNSRNDARTLSGVISKKQRFDKSSFEKLKKSFPCILAGIRDFAEYIPLESDLFDLVIIDEASQVSIAQAFPALLRGKKIIVLGDKKQFSNVKAAHARSDTNREYLNRLRDVFLETISDESAKIERLEKFNIKTSILEFFERITNYSIMLKKHFRGYKETISYSSKYFYDDSLQAIKIRAKPIEQVIKFTVLDHDGQIEVVDNSNRLEIEALVAELERITVDEPDASVGILTPHTNQQKLLMEAFSKHENYEHFQKVHKLKIMTFDTCQGEERDIILYSMVANPVSDKLWGIFIKDRTSVDLEEGGQIKLQRLNVGFSRAKECMHFFLSKPIEEFSGSIGEALQHYKKTSEAAKKLPESDSTDARSPMEKKVLNWVQETGFFKTNTQAIELHTQFPLGDYIKQLDKRYKHPAYVVDFLLVFTDEHGKQHKIIIEYDGFEAHFQDHGSVNEFNYDQYYTDAHVYREKVLESYGYNFLRINRFNAGKDPIATLDRRLAFLVKKKSRLTP